MSGELCDNLKALEAATGYDTVQVNGQRRLRTVSDELCDNLKALEGATGYDTIQVNGQRRLATVSDELCDNLKALEGATGYDIVQVNGQRESPTVSDELCDNLKVPEAATGYDIVKVNGQRESPTVSDELSDHLKAPEAATGSDIIPVNGQRELPTLSDELRDHLKALEGATPYDFVRMIAERKKPTTSDEMSDTLKALEASTGYDIVQVNGQRKMGPPRFWKGPPPPTKGCEVFIGKLPTLIYEDELFPLFQSAGLIYEFRLMMNFSGSNRGYAFCTYATRAQARRCIEMFDDFEIRSGWRIGVRESADNRVLFVKGLPLDKSKREVVAEMSKHTEGVVKVSLFKCRFNPSKNGAYAYVEYESHRAASLARKVLIPYNIKLFGREVIYDWLRAESFSKEEKRRLAPTRGRSPPRTNMKNDCKPSSNRATARREDSSSLPHGYWSNPYFSMHAIASVRSQMVVTESALPEQNRENVGSFPEFLVPEEWGNLNMYRMIYVPVPPHQLAMWPGYYRDTLVLPQPSLLPDENKNVSSL